MNYAASYAFRMSVCLLLRVCRVLCEYCLSVMPMLDVFRRLVFGLMTAGNLIVSVDQMTAGNLACLSTRGSSTTVHQLQKERACVRAESQFVHTKPASWCCHCSGTGSAQFTSTANISHSFWMVLHPRSAASKEHLGT